MKFHDLHETFFVISEQTTSFLETIKSFGVTAAIVMTVGTVVVFVSLVVCFVCCCRQCVNKKRQEANSTAGSTTTTTATSVTINNGTPFPIPGKFYIKII